MMFALENPPGLRTLSLLVLGASASAAATIQARDPVPEPYVAAPFYPAPFGGWSSDWSESYERAVALVSNMTVAEKVNLTTGTGLYMGPCVGNTGSVPRLGIPNLCLQDGPLGVRTTENVTAFPAGITTGATFNKDLMYERGVALGEEFKGKGVNFYLGPAVGPLGRKPRGGRNWEAFGVDPVLQAWAGRQTIKGVQDQGVIATLKHTIGNEQEVYRMYNPFQDAYSSNIDDRSMHELYLWPFAEGIRAGVGSIMSAYNAVNGSASSQNSYLLSGLLKNELGFQGLIMTDWLAQISGVGSALAGLDMSMPGDTIGNSVPLFGLSDWAYELTTAVLNGTVPVSRINDMAVRIVATWYQLGQDAEDYPRPNFSSNTDDKEGPYYPGALISPSGQVNWYVDVQADHAKVAKQVAQEAITLLKNNGSMLPLTNSSNFVVFGTDAQADPDGINACVDKACDNGLLSMGWGSGSASLPYLDAPIDALKRRAANVTYHDTDSFPSDAAGEAAADDVAIVFVNSDSGENSYTVEGNHGDRDKTGLAAYHNGDQLVQDVADAYANVVVVYHTVGPVVMEPWVSHPSVRAVVNAHLPGQEAGDSLMEVLFGDVAPSGKLPYSIPVREDDYPESLTHLDETPLSQTQDTYSEGLYVDYRWLNHAGVKPRFAFGHGLSYTNFTFSGASIRAGGAALSKTPPPAADSSEVTSPVAGMDAALPAAAEAYYPDGFDKIWRYLYSYLDRGAADKAHAIGAKNNTSSSYPYPEGYSTTQKPLLPAGGAPGGNPALWDEVFALSLEVANAGAAAGKAVPQAYLQFPASYGATFGFDTPPVQLRDFAKTRVLAAGEAETVALRLTRKDLSVWDVVSQNWIVPDPAARYKVWLGEASDKLTTVCYTDTLECEEGVTPPV
ncbi:glycoside hydrolase family 3 protein [Xylariomycetidae sp. FL0641]|nr:glycoside hydrolase family 3 protein [Xylariomycetidae sp. FL0641]